MSFFVKYLEGRTFIVKTPEQTSRVESINAGVPQGSILGPLLFNIYVNDLPLAVTSSNIVMYADDTTLITSSSLPDNLQVKMAGDLERVEKWFSNNKLKLNTDKTEYILIVNNRRRQLFQDVKIGVGGKSLIEKSSTKILGSHHQQ